MDKFKVIIIQNIISPYKTLLFNSLKQILNNFKVIYLAETAINRKWRVNKEELQFEFDLLFNGEVDNINHIKIAVEIYRKLNFYNPDVVMVGGYDYTVYWAALIWSKVNKRKVILINESHYLDKKRFVVKETIKKIFIANCAASLVAGTRHRDYINNFGMESENIFIMKGVGGINYNIYKKDDLEKYRKNKRKICKKLKIPDKNFLYVGRFSPEKNLIFLLSVYKNLKGANVDNWGMILVGDGPQKNEIENFIYENKIRNVLLVGYKQTEELPLFYAISDVFILPSISEPWGLVVNEAMASGLPIIISDRCGCYPDLVKEGINGYSFNPFDKNELLNIMENIIEEKYDLKKMGQTSLKIIKDYTSETMAQIFKKAINSVMSKG